MGPRSVLELLGRKEGEQWWMSTGLLGIMGVLHLQQLIGQEDALGVGPGLAGCSGLPTQSCD